MCSRLSFALALTCLAGLGTAPPVAAADKPNVLFIAVDDLNHWVGYFGRNPQAKTPNLDRLAARGVAFTQAHCAVPACNPSRAALMSGLRPWTTGCYTNGDSWKEHIKEGLGLSKQFLDAGYHVAGAGKIYHSDSYYESEWSEYISKEGLSTSGKGVGKHEGFHDPLEHDLADQDLSDWQTVDWCIERLQQQTDEPLFLACGLHKPHLPFAVPRKYYDLFPLDEIQLPPHREDDLDDIPPAGIKMAKPDGDHAKFLESGRWKAAIQSYLATVAYLDMNVGRLMDAFDRSPYRDNTIIVLWGDHGWHFGEKQHWRKFALWEEATRSPLIWVAPGVTQAGTQCDRTVDFMSIYPTLCDLAGLPIPEHVQGRSIRALLENPSAPWDQPAITTHGYKNHAVRSEGWRYIQYADGSEELYDHSEDPYEWTNLAGDPQRKAVIRQHAAFLPETNVQATRRGGNGNPANKKAGRNRSGSRAEDNTLTRKQKNDGWQMLFDGRSLSGWSVKSGFATYKVEEDSIVGTTAQGSPNTFLTSDATFGDFELTVDVLLESDPLNSGVQIRSKLRDDGKYGGRVYGPQVEIEASPGQAGFIYGEAAGGWQSPEPQSDDKAVSQHRHFKNGQWNQFRVRADGRHIQTWINGHKIADLQYDPQRYEDNPAGFIGLQVHGVGDRGPFQVRWKNIYIRPLDDPQP